MKPGKIFNEGDSNKIEELFHDNAVNHQVANDPMEGKETILLMFKWENRISLYNAEMKKTFIILVALIFSFMASAQETDTLDLKSEKATVINLVEQFLIAAGNYDLDLIPSMFSEKANIYGASLRDGKWNTNTMTIQEFLDRLKSRNNPTKYTEPVSGFTVHMEMGMLAFVKADAVFTINGEPINNNFDYFTLIKEDGNWKILNGSYVSVRINK